MAIVILTKRQHSADSSDTVFCFVLVCLLLLFFLLTLYTYILKVLLFCDATVASCGTELTRKLLLLRVREVDRCEVLLRIHSYITAI